MDKISVFLIHTQPLLRQGLRNALVEQKDIEVVAEARDSEEALSLTKGLCPKIVILDSRLLSTDSVDVARKIGLGPPRASLIVIAGTENDNELFLAFIAGAAAFLAGPVSAQDVVEVVRYVNRGGHPIEEALLHKPRVALPTNSQKPTVSRGKVEAEGPLPPISEHEITQMLAPEEAVKPSPEAKEAKVRIAIGKGITGCVRPPGTDLGEK